MKVHGEASRVDAENGKVVVDGPDGVAVTLTADAALETSERIEGAAVKAKGQEQMRAAMGLAGTKILERDKQRRR